MRRLFTVGECVGECVDWCVSSIFSKTQSQFFLAIYSFLTHDNAACAWKTLRLTKCTRCLATTNFVWTAGEGSSRLLLMTAQTACSRSAQNSDAASLFQSAR